VIALADIFESVLFVVADRIGTEINGRKTGFARIVLCLVHQHRPIAPAAVVLIHIEGAYPRIEIDPADKITGDKTGAADYLPVFDQQVPLRQRPGGLYGITDAVFVDYRPDALPLVLEVFDGPHLVCGRLTNGDNLHGVNISHECGCEKPLFYFSGRELFRGMH
jgi:hypothetical protein